MTRQHRRTDLMAHPERGSVAMASLLVVFAAMLGVVVVGQSVARLGDAATDADRAAASAGAELAIVEAAALIDQGASADFSGTVDTPSAQAGYDATRIDADTWEIYGASTAGEATQARLVTLGRAAGADPSEASFALFADRSISFHQEGRNTIAGGLGSNGPVVLGATSTTEPVTLYQPDGTCIDCSDTVVVAGPWKLPEPILPTIETRSCPREGQFPSTVDGMAGAPFLCLWEERIVFPSTTTVINPPVIIHVGSDVEIDMERSSINAGGSAADFYLLVRSAGSWRPALLEADGARFNGYLYAPGRRIAVQNFSANGAAVVGEVYQPSGGDVSFSYDPALSGLPGAADPDSDSDGRWGITGWQKVEPRS